MAAVALAALVATGLLGCGGSGGDTDTTRVAEHDRALQGEAGGKREECERLASESQREECERAGAAALIPERDRVAYYQLATAVGLVRSAAIATARRDGPPSKAGPRELAAALQRVRRTHPLDRSLIGVRRRIIGLLAGPRGLDRIHAGLALAALPAIEHALADFLGREPANAVLLPD